MESQIKLILLDFDGTLADTRRANALAYIAALAEAGYELTEEVYLANYFGMRCDEFLTRFGITDPEEREQLRLRKIVLYPTFFDTVQLNRPLWDFCQQFRAQGGRVWIVSTGSRANIENAMHHLGIAGPEQPGSGERKTASPGWGRAKTAELYAPGVPATGEWKVTGIGNPGADGAVDGILTGTDVAQSKPAPDCFLEAMRREGVTPRQTLIFEDSAIGIEAARRSGAAYFVVKSKG